MRMLTQPMMIKTMVSGALALGMSLSTPVLSQSDMDRRNTEIVQSVYLRTLSVEPSSALVRDAETALDLAARSYGATDGRTADMAVNLGRVLNDTAQYGAAISAIESALSIYDETAEDTQLRTAVARYELGRALAGNGDSQAAIEALSTAYAVIEPAFRSLSTDAGFVLQSLREAGGADAVAKAEDKARSAPALSNTPQPEATVRIPPIYPPDAPDTKGWALLDFRLWPDGAVRDVVVLAGSPSRVFDISAAMALSYWQFEPQQNGNQHYQLSIVFDERN